MILIATAPLWLGVLIWFINAGLKSQTKVTVIQRTVTAPDGRTGTFLVPPNEPASVSIARLYADGVIEYPQASISRSVAVDTLLQSPILPKRPPPKKFMVACLIIVAFFCALSQLRTGPQYSENYSPRTYQPEKYSTIDSPPAQPAPVWTGSSTPASITNAAPGTSVERVRLKNGANLRASASRGSAVLRIVNQGDIFIKFGEANGWTQVGQIGTDRPEGWLANSTIATIAQ